MNLAAEASVDDPPFHHAQRDGAAELERRVRKLDMCMSGGADLCVLHVVACVMLGDGGRRR